MFSRYLTHHFFVLFLSLPCLLWGQETTLRPISIVTPEADIAAPVEIASVESRLYVSIEKQARHLLTKVHPWDQDPALKLLTDSKHDEHWIRPNTGTVSGLAFLCRFGEYDAAVVGISREQLISGTLIPMMRYLTATHLTGGRATGDGKCWGSQWQSAHWAHMLGRGAWWIWDNLPMDLQDGVRRVVAHEADRIAASDPPHGVEEDTKAEENAWNSQILSVAVALMPEDPHRPVWEQDFQRWALSSFQRASDRVCGDVVDGKPVSEQFTGANIYDDFTLENHGRVHPDYMAAFTLSAGCVLDYAMSGRTCPDAAFWNVPGIYANLKWFSLPGGGLVYPNGQDWELFRDPEWTYLHLLMAGFGHDPDAWRLMLPCLDTQERMQARSASGTVYLDEEFFFPSTLSDQLYYSAMAWLAARYHKPIEDRYTERTGILRLDSGKIILHRMPKVIHTFSWGAAAMAQVIPFRLDRLTSPHPRSGIGYVRIEGAKDPLAVAMHAADVVNDAQSFEAHVEIDHGEDLIRAYLTFCSSSDGRWRVYEKLVALREVTTAEIATGMIGVLNNPQWIYESGERRVTFDGISETVVAATGANFRRDGVRTADIDGALQIHGETPLNLLYRGVQTADRARFTDEFYLNYSDTVRTWQTGDVLSEFEATVYCPEIR